MGASVVKQFTIISQDNCVYCEKAKALLEAEGYEYTEFNLSHGFPALKEFIAACGATTVPQVFDGNWWVGGFDALEDHLNGYFD